MLSACFNCYYTLKLVVSIKCSVEQMIRKALRNFRSIEHFNRKGLPNFRSTEHFFRKGLRSFRSTEHFFRIGLQSFRSTEYFFRKGFKKSLQKLAFIVFVNSVASLLHKLGLICTNFTYFSILSTHIILQTLEQLQSGKLKGATRVKMACELTEFPRELFSLANTLEILDLSGNHLSSLPEDFHLFHQLKILFLSENRFTVFPEALGKCKQLEMIGFKANQIEFISEEALPANTRWLILTNNKLQKMPKSIGKCARMQKLMLAGNQLKTLPSELKECKNLGLLRIAANNLTDLPDWLLTMPKLCWIAFSGNPFSIKKDAEETQLAAINWNELTLLEQLGEGASGIIWKASWKKETGVEEVAIKLFKGAITSDGLPDDEMNACMLAGNHPNLVNLIGKLVNHPEGNKGLVLSLIPPHYTILGNTPSFESCTRDVYKEETSFSLNDTITIAKGISSVAFRLHEKGILHGDLYAHNTLIGNDGHPLFGDFGAASFYNTNHPSAFLLERIEVNAFGCLLEDLITYTKADDSVLRLIKLLFQLKEDCMQATVTERPSFFTICKRLNEISQEFSDNPE